MKTNISSNNLNFSIEKDNQKMFLSKDWWQPCYYLETIPHEGEVTFTIENSFDKIEREIYNQFEDLLIKIFGRFLIQGYSRGMDVDVLNKEIRIISENLTKNSLTIKYTYDKIEFIFKKGKKESYQNNRIIMDIEGVLIDGYYKYINDLFNNLCAYEQDKARIRKP